MYHRKIWSKDDGAELPVYNETHYLSLIAMGHLQEAPDVAEEPAESAAGAMAAGEDNGSVRQSEVHLARESGREYPLPATAAIDNDGRSSEGDTPPVAGVRRARGGRSNRKRPSQD